ncbi:MAG TPA: hypothetical protein DCD96_00245 [Flavobacteriales bacterium]|nr:hypothetical protein [Flavobacteriales bacterium]HRE74691.1 hypothetical protein [Flavobacteriales bacterium]HRJ38006.1 hypothetical protein [Flavobacteriales bacterium]
MKRWHIIALLFFVSFQLQAQEKEKIRNPHPTGRWYGISTFDMLLSNGEFISNGVKWTPKTRFIPFFNLQSQTHYNGKHIGVFTGMGIRNIGFHHFLERDSAETIYLKQRAYSVNIPAGLKFGNLVRGNYIALGSEAHYLFHYKSKLKEGNKTSREREWFSSKINPFSVSVFADLRFKSGSYFKVNFFLFDFLRSSTYNRILPLSGESINFSPEKSTLIYFSFGTALKVKKKQPLTLKDV